MAPTKPQANIFEQAVAMLHEREAWLAAHGSEIEAHINEGNAAAGGGELLEPDEVRSRLGELKRAWLGEQKRG